MPGLAKTVKGLWSLLVGLGVTGVEFFRPQLTVHYPRKEVDNLATYRGHIDLVAREDDPLTPRCIVCRKCVAACPSGCIDIESRLVGAAPSGDARELSLAPGLIVTGTRAAPPPREKIRREVAAFRLNYNLCSLCGLCVQTCPVQSLTFSREAYLCGSSRSDFEFELLERLRRRAAAGRQQAA